MARTATYTSVAATVSETKSRSRLLERPAREGWHALGGRPFYQEGRLSARLVSFQKPDSKPGFCDLARGGVRV
jgi:hypothetical protein